MLSATGAFAALQAVAAWHAGVFEYPLDDVYIHLAMAEKTAQGTYGVNLGDPASASSSILYPFLLLPFPGTEAQRLLPLFWNILAVAGAGWVWGLVAAAARLAGAAGMAIVVAGPVFLNIPGVGYTGMEAAPHLLASLVVVLGLWLALNRKGAAWWLVGAAIAAPLLRYEGLALSLAAAATLWLWGHRRAAGVIACGALGAVIGFSVFFLYLGLDPLPGSILEKIGTLDPQGGIGSRLLVGLLANLIKPAGAILAGLVVAVVATAVAIPALRRGPAGAIVATVGAAASAHLVFGQVGWMHRYERYIIVSFLGAFLLAGSAAGPGAGSGAARIAQGAALATTAAAAIAYGPTLWGTYVWNPRAIHLQQAQMARMAQDYLKVPVAANDLGRVAWGNPAYVLDIWGLGSVEVRDIRFGAVPFGGWAAPLAAEHGVRTVMIYDTWFASAAGPDWVRVATPSITRPKGAIGAWTVAIYAVDPAYAAELRAHLAAIAPTLPEGAVLSPEGGA
jgi:hypothetical protein